MKTIIAAILATGFAQIVFAAECKNGDVVRKVEVKYETEGKKAPCLVNYTKEDGTEKTLFSAKAEEGYCEKKSSEFQEKLKSMGWTCADQ